MKLLSGTSNKTLSLKIAKILKTKLVNSNIKRFADGEIYVEVNEKLVIDFEDLSKNLMPAHKIGITTIHITPNEIEKSPPFINFRFKTIISALDMIKNCIN